MTDKVPNQYRSALVASRWSADERAKDIRSALNAATLAMQAGAWKSTTADTFGHALAEHRSRLQSVASEERDAIDAEVARQPEEVEPNTWEATWARMSRMRE